MLTHTVQDAYTPLARLSGVPLVEWELVLQQREHLWGCRVPLEWHKPVGFLFLLSAVLLQRLFGFFPVVCCVFPFKSHVAPAKWSLDDHAYAGGSTCLSKLPSLKGLELFGRPLVVLHDSIPGISMTSRTLANLKFKFSWMDESLNDVAPQRGMQCILYNWRFLMQAHT